MKRLKGIEYTLSQDKKIMRTLVTSYDSVRDWYQK